MVIALIINVYIGAYVLIPWSEKTVDVQFTYFLCFILKKYPYRVLSVELPLTNQSKNSCFQISSICTRWPKKGILRLTVVNYYFLLSVQNWLYLKTKFSTFCSLLLEPNYIILTLLLKWFLTNIFDGPVRGPSLKPF